MPEPIKKGKADRTVKGTAVLNSWKSTAFFHHGVTNCGFRTSSLQFKWKELAI